MTHNQAEEILYIDKQIHELLLDLPLIVELKSSEIIKREIEKLKKEKINYYNANKQNIHP